MNLRHYHRSNTEEYKRELQELNGLAQLPLLPRTRLTFPPEFAGKAIHHPIIYSHSQPLTKSEPLMKAGFKQLKQMFSGTDEHDHVLKWTADNIKHNDLQSFYLRNYKKNPKIHTTANKNKLGHINGMMDISSEMKNVKLTKDDTLESAFQKYDEVEKAWREGSGSRFIKPSTKTKPVVDFGDGWKWFDLGVAKSKNEGDAMGHCGNCGDPHKNDRILSLRKIVKVGNKTFHEPALTFINNEGWLGEMKGRANNKPHHKYHRRIVELLKHRDIKGIVGGGYQSENNFHFDDLSPEHKNQIKMSNPNFVDLKSGDWNHKQKLFAAGSVPRIQKYEQITNKIYKKNGLLNQIESGVRSIDQVVEIYPSEAAEYLKDHPSLNSQHIDKIVEKDPRAAAEHLKDHPFLNSQHIDKIVEKYPWAAKYLKDNKLLNSQHIDKIVEKVPGEAAEYLNKHKLLTSQHIDKIVEKDPRAAAKYLNNPSLLNSQHIDKIVENVPQAAAEHLKDHPLLTSQHIDKIVEKDPYTAAEYLNKHKLLTSQHIDKIVEKYPYAAAEYLKDHPSLNSQHIDKIVEKESRIAAEYLKDHPSLNSQHIDKIVEKEPRAAAEHLNKHKLLNSQHIDKIVEKDPYAAAWHLNNHPSLNSQHIDKIVEEDPGAAAKYLKDNKLLNSQHIDKIVENKPRTAAAHLNNHPLFNSQHIDKIVEKAPEAAAIHFDKHPLFNSQHIDKIIEKDPFAAAEYLKDHPLLNSQHIDKIVEKDPEAAAEYLKDHPYYIQKYGQQKIQKSFKQLKNEYERLTKANVDEINRFIEAHGYHFAAVKFKNDPNLNSQHIDQIVEEDPWAAAEYLKDHPSFNSQHIDQIVEENPWAAAEHLNKHKLLTSQHIDKIVENVPGAAAAHYLSDHPLLNSQHIDKIVEKDPEAAAAYLKDHPLFSSQHIDKIVEKAPGAAADYLKDHPLFSSQHIDKIVEKAPGAAADYLKNHPYYIQKYANKNQINFSNNTEILRKLRDTIQEQGGVVNAKDLPKLGFNENSLRINHLKDAKGNYTDTAIQQHIDNQSKHTYNISHTIWKGVQRHSKRGTQSVFQLNYTQEMEKQLKDAGVLDTFEAAHKASFNSNHPVRENTLGWVRYTKGSDGHIHIDEVQSDLGRNLHNVAQGQIEQAEREGQKLSPQEKERLLDLFSKEKIDKMNDIMFKGHHPSKLLHEAFLQHLRNTGHVGKDIHIWQAMPKAKLAGQKTDIHLTNIDLQNFVDFHNKLQNNNIDDFFHDDNDGYEFTNDVVSGLLGDEQASNLYSKHFKNFDITESTPEERQNYINDFVKSKPYQMTLNHLNSHKNPHDSLNAALEHPSIKDKHIKLPFTHNDLPVHMKIGYHETPIRMGYEAGNYGNIETQENDKLKNQPTWKQPLRKSLKALTAEYERLQKAFEANGTWYPEQTDRLGLPHPVQKHLVVHRARNGKHVWSYHPELSRIFDRNLIQLMGGQKISTRNNIQLPNKITSLQKPTVSAIRGFAADLLKNPDRHVMSANTDPTKDRSHSEMRVRHLISALTGSDGYEIKDHSEGFEVYAPRHSKSQKAQEIATRWIYNASKKELRSERIYPTSPDGGNNNGKFGKSIRPRPSSNTGRRYVDAGKSASSRPRSSKDIVGKNKTLVKSLNQLIKEYEILKRSKNAKQKIKNISEEERKKRLLAYAENLGLTPVHDERDEEQELPNSYSGSQFYFNPNDELFSPEHEIGHAMLSPEGESVGAYMKRISSSPTQKDNRDEIINHALDAKIARRAGVAPRSVVPPPDLYEDAGEPIPKPLTFKTAFSPYQNEVKEIIEQFDEGKKFDSKGIKNIKDSIDRKINIRAKEAAKDVSRKDAKTLMRSQALKKAEDEAGMTAYPLKDGYSIHHETSQNGYDIWSIGHNGQRAGSFMICTDETRRGRPFVSWAGVDKPHRGKGIGAAVYKTLAVHYGGLDSDRNSTSVDAIKAWRRAGGRQIKVKTAFGDYRYTLDGDKKRPPIVWNEDLEKNTNKISPSFAHIKNIDNFDDFTQSAKKLPETAKKEIINYQEEYNKNPPLSSNEELYYHGTPFFNEIKEGGFKNTEGGRAGFLGFVHKVQNLGNYLSNDKKLAHYYGSDRAGHHTNNSKNYEVLSVKVDKGNCLDLTEPKVKIPTAIKKLGLKRLQQYDGLLRSHFIRGKDMVVLLDDPDFVKSLTNHGYDSVKFKEDKGILKNANSSGHTLFVMNPNKLKVHKPIHTLRDMFNHFKELSEEDMSKGQSLEKTNASKSQNMVTFYHGSDTLPIGKKPTKGGFLALDKEFAQNFGNTVHEFVFPSEKILDLRNKNHLEILKTKYPQSDIDFIKGSSQDLPNAFTHEQNATERLEKLKNMALSLGFHGTYQKESDWPNQPVSVEIYNTKHLVPKQNISKSEDLEKGARGDWEKEEGYKVHVNDDIHEPQAVVTHKGKKIGGLNTIKTPHGIKVSMVYVDPEHQRKGLATAMYQAVETKTKTKLIPSDKQTAQGQALWEQPNRQFGKSRTDANKLEKNKMNKSEDFSRVSSVVVVTNDKMLMLQRRDNNKWTFPSGHLNDTETHLEGAVRELWEEAGIRANPDEMILLGNKKTFQNKDIHVYLYIVNSEVKPSAANDPDKEAQKFAWLPHVLPEDIKENLYIPVGDNSSLSMFSVWLLRQKTNKLKELVESKKKS